MFTQCNSLIRKKSGIIFTCGGASIVIKTIKKKSLIPEEDSGYETEEIPFIDTDTPAKPSQPAKPTAKVKKPKPTAIRKLKAGRKYFTVKWKKIKGVKGYQIQYSTNKKFKKKYKGKKQTVKIVTVKKAKATSRKINKLKTNKRYYVRIRTYKVVKGKRIYSKWSKVKRIKTKK